MDEADALCDRLAIVDKGKIVLEGTPQQLKEDYQRRHGTAELPSLEEVFMEVTGRSLEDSDLDEDDQEGHDG